MRSRVREAAFAITSRIVFATVLLVAACTPGQQITPLTTTVTPSIGTLVRTSGLIDAVNNCNPAVPPAPNVQTFWNGLPVANRAVVGFELWRNTTGSCTTSRLDVYRALVTFDMAAQSDLRGLVTQGDLIVTSRILPSGVSAGNAACVPMTGGAGTLERFGPAAVATLPPTSATGVLTYPQPPPAPPPLPSGGTVFVFPRPWSAGTIAGAASPTTTLASGTGGATFTVDVTSQVNAALNGGLTLAWMLTSAFEGPLTTPVPTSLDCRTSYTVRLRLTHL